MIDAAPFLFIGLLVYAIGAGTAYGMGQDDGRPSRELPGRAVLWPLFALVWLYSAFTTGLVTLTRSKEKAETAAAELEDEEEPES